MSGITVNGQEVVNFCANNSLGLANHSDILWAVQAGFQAWGYWLSSIRFICSMHVSHKQGEQIARFFSRQDTHTQEENIKAKKPMAAAISNLELLPRPLRRGALGRGRRHIGWLAHWNRS